jgi:type IV secretion system protein VirB6
MFGLGSVTILAGTMLAATIITTIIFAKFMLAILLAVGPIFIVFLLFDATRRLFEAWLGQLIAVVVLLIIFGLAVTLVSQVIMRVIELNFIAYITERILTTVTTIAGDFLGFGSSSTIAPSPVKGLGIVMVCVVCQQFLAKVPPVADAIGRSLSMNLQTGLARK